MAPLPGSFPCTSHLTPREAAEALIDHFASICQQLSPLDSTHLPTYLPTRTPPPVVQQYEVYQRLSYFIIKRSTIPTNLPMPLIKEFAAELATPLTSIIIASLQQSKCLSSWMTSYITPIGKTTNLATFSDLRSVAITPLPSLLCESFVNDWI